MQAQGKKRPTEIDDTLSVQLERLNGRSPRRRQPHDQAKIAVPGKMLAPNILPWVKEWHHRAADGISSLGLGIFVIVAALAGKCQIVEQRLSTPTPGDDVLDRVSLDTKTSLAATVFTAVSRTLDNGLTFCRADGAISGTVAAQYRVPS
jgi:hypothetical protein